VRFFKIASVASKKIFSFNFSVNMKISAEKSEQLKKKYKLQKFPDHLQNSLLFPGFSLTFQIPCYFPVFQVGILPDLFF
jgi:hypothetical protein